MHYTYTKDLLSLFRSGMDTSYIAHITGFHEHYVYNQLHEQREAERLKSPKPKRSPSQDWNSDAAY